MSERPLGQVTALPGHQCQHQPPATTEYTGHISCQELTLARQCLWHQPASPCLPAGTSRRGQERRKQIKGEAEQLVTRSWQLSPGFPAQPLQQSSLSGPSLSAPCQLTPEGEGAVHVYADAKMGRQAGELAFVMLQDPRERADIMGNNLLWFFFLKEKVLALGQRSETSAGLRKAL